jgi:hypothetical protein
MDENKNKNKINIDLSEDVAEGIYSNLAIITHSHAEFIVDFVKMLPGIPKAKVKSRIILTPEHAKRLTKALNDNIRKFESMHGPIKESKDGGMPPFTFGGPTAQA